MTSQQITACKRCGMPVRIEPKAGSKATMLRRGKTTDGFCLHCAVHDWLRHTYPINVQLAEAGPKILLHPQVREMFTAIMKTAHADALPDEVNWNLVVENWDVPWSEPVKTSGNNPVSQQELDEIASGQRPGLRETGRRRSVKGKHLLDPTHLVIRSWEELNELEPGLGDDLREALDCQLEGKPGAPRSEPPDDPPPKQQRLFE